MSDQEFKIWLAGFFDGEGSVGLTSQQHSQWKQPRISLTQKGKIGYEVLEHVRSIYGGSISIHVRTKDVHQWSLAGNISCATFLEDIFPYLKIKQQRAELVLAICKLREDKSEAGQVLRTKLEEAYVEAYPPRGGRSF